MLHDNLRWSRHCVSCGFVFPIMSPDLDPTEQGFEFRFAQGQWHLIKVQEVGFEEPPLTPSHVAQDLAQRQAVGIMKSSPFFR